MIKISNLNKYYNKNKANELHVINNTTIELPSKGLISFLGTSGSGKTTLLNVIGGLDKAKGTIQYDDKIIKNYQMGKIDSYRKSNIGYIFQNYNLLPDKTVYENLAIQLELIDVYDKKEIDKRIEYTLKSVGMFKYRKKLAHALSGGQQQRVAIARALVKNAKIIIADEPTGNLDSENTIEVMNILKKISKNTLVLLVTHNNSIADFYSDRIIRVKDGKITESFDNGTEKSLQRLNTNKIYLKDMDLCESVTDFGTIKLYTENKESISIDLNIIVNNGNIYLESSSPIKLIEDTNIKLVDDHYTDLKLSDVDATTYDTSWFNDGDKSFKTKVMSFFHLLKESFVKFRFANRRAKFLNFTFVLLGILLGAAVICMINFSTPDETDFVYAEDYKIITSTNHIFYDDPINSIQSNYVDGKIDLITINEPESKITLKHHYSFNKNIILNLEVLVARFDPLIENSLIHGTKPVNNNEIVVDETTATEMVKEYGVGSNVEYLIGKTLILNRLSSYEEVVVVGICTNSKRAVYGTDYFYTKWATAYSVQYFGSRRYYKNEVDSNGEPLYEVVKGRDLEELTIEVNREVLLHHEHEKVNEEEIILGGYVYKIVGSYKYKDNTFDVGVDEYITNIVNPKMESAFTNYALNDDQFTLIDGRKPEKFDECMVSIYTGKKIGETFDGRKIVGIYNGTKKALSTFSVVDTNTFILTNFSYEDICFRTKTDDLTTHGDEVVISLYDYQNEMKKQQEVSNLELFKLLSVIIIIFSSIFTYLVMRSKMLSDIYNVGVYRSIGAKRSKVIATFFIDLLVTITFTTLIGYLAILFIYNICADSLNEILTENIFRINNDFFVGGLLISYVFTIIIGLLPIALLLRKTPSEICNKYDV